MTDGDGTGYATMAQNGPQTPVQRFSGRKRLQRQASPAEAVLGALTERRWQHQVTTLAELFGWRWYHTHDSRRSPAGFVDLVLVRRPRVIFAELKTDTGRLSDDQRDWLDALDGCTVESYLWRPRDVEQVKEVLR